MSQRWADTLISVALLFAALLSLVLLLTPLALLLYLIIETVRGWWA